MSDFNVYAIYDRVGLRYRSINLDDPKFDVARRNLAYAVNHDPQLQFMAKDFDFVKIGEFDSEKGVLIPCVPSQVVCHVNELIGANFGLEING